jgi:hypothetical protein
LATKPKYIFRAAILAISKGMIQNSEQTSPGSITDPPFTETNDRLFEIADKSVLLRFGLNRGDRFPVPE